MKYNECSGFHQDLLIDTPVKPLPLRLRVCKDIDSYSRKHPDIMRRITMIDIGTCPYPGWSGDYFRIHFENRGGTR